MLKDVELLIEFQDEAIKYGTYLKNRLIYSLKIDGICYILINAYINKTLKVKYIRLFGVKCYFWVNRKSLLKHGKINKLMLFSRVSIFIRFSEEIIKQYKIYALNLQYIIKLSIINIIKNVIKGIINLNFKRSRL